MAHYSNSEKVDMLKAYFLSNENALAAKRLYTNWYGGERNIPNERTFVNIVQGLRDHGSFKLQTQDRGRPQTRRVRNVEPQILNAVEENPGTSSRRLSHEFHVSQRTVLRTLHMQGLHPYHVQKVQALLPDDLPRRREFCEWILRKCELEEDFLRYILWTDEAGFTREGMFNAHNTHIWADENPNAIRETHYQQQFSLNIWAGIVDNTLIGPHVLPRRLTGQMYLELLDNNLEDLLENVPLAVRQQMWIQHDGAPPHSARIVSDWLNNNYRDKWIGRYGPIPWPPRSPDLNPCDFYLWGHMKQLVYSEPVNTLEQLRVRIDNAGDMIRRNITIFQNVRESMIRRTRACLESNGGHFEHLL